MESRHKRDPTTFPAHDRPPIERKKHLNLELPPMPVIKEETKEDKKRIHYHATKSKSTLFLPSKEEKPAEDKPSHSPQPSPSQNVTVTVTVNESQEDCATSCWSGLVKCFGRS